MGGVVHKSGETGVPLLIPAIPTGHPRAGAQETPKAPVPATLGGEVGAALRKERLVLGHLLWGCSWRPKPGSESSDSGGAGSPAYRNALDLAGLDSSGPGFRPPPPRAPLSPGQRKKPTPRPPPRALTAREAPGPLWAKPPGRTPAESPACGPQPAHPPGLCTRVATATPPSRPCW